MNFVLNEKGDNHLVRPNRNLDLKSRLTETFKHSWVKNVPWHPMTQDQGYNVFALHTKWDQAEVEKVLGDGAVYVTILRDPVDQFESMYNYLHFEEEFKTDLEGFVKNYVKGRRPVTRRFAGYLGQNQQLCDLGMDVDLLNDDRAVKNKIMALDKDFDLVMLVEEFDESIVLF